MAKGALVVMSVPLEAPPEWPALSTAERAVAELALQGLTVRAIAARRHVRVSTIARQLESAYRKLDVGSRGELAARASQLSAGRRGGR